VACLPPVRKALPLSKEAARLWRPSRLEVYMEGAADTPQFAVSAKLDSTSLPITLVAASSSAWW